MLRKNPLPVRQNTAMSDYGQFGFKGFADFWFNKIRRYT